MPFTPVANTTYCEIRWQHGTNLGENTSGTSGPARFPLPPSSPPCVPLFKAVSLTASVSA